MRRIKGLTLVTLYSPSFCHIENESLNCEAKCIHAFDECYHECSGESYHSEEESEEHQHRKSLEEDEDAEDGHTEHEELLHKIECEEVCHSELINCDNGCSSVRSDNEDAKTISLSILIGIIILSFLMLGLKFVSKNKIRSLVNDAHSNARSEK